MRGDPLEEYRDYLERREIEAEGTDRHIIEIEDLLGITVDYIDDALDETESATAGDTPLLRIAITDDITQRTNTIKEQKP